MDLNLTGKVALVSGSTAGIGYAAALGLAKQGAQVIVNGRTEERVNAAIALIRKAAPTANVVGFAADLATAAGAKALVAAHPAVDILVNNLGLGGKIQSFDKTDDEAYAELFDVNVISGLRLSRAYLPTMRTRNWGRILFVSSIAALTAPADLINYNITKVAQITAARGLAESVAGTNITVNSVIVGPTITDAANGMFQEMAANHGIPAEYVTKMFVDQTLVKRMLAAEEIANMIVYLSSPAASGTTGSAVRVDGGTTHPFERARKHAMHYLSLRSNKTRSTLASHA